MEHHIRIWILVIYATISGPALGDQTNFLLLGTANKGSSGAGITQLNGFEAVGQNPSAIGIGKPVMIGSELALVSLKYNYSIPDYEPAAIELNSPIIFLGGTYDLPARLTLGWSLMPIPGGASKLEVKSVPLRALSETPAIIDVSTENTAPLDYKFASGLSWNLTRRLNLGISANFIKSETRTIISDAESGTSIIDVSSVSKSAVYTAGATVYLPGNIRIGAIYQTTTEIDLKGKGNNENGPSFSTSAKLGDGFGLGIEGGLSWLSAFTEIRVDRRSQDKGITDPIMLMGTGVLDRYNTLSHVFGIKSRIRKHRLTMSYGWFPSSVGDGIMAALDADKTEYFGVGFGDLSAISRHHYGIGDEWTWRNLVIKTSLSMIDGNRKVPEWSRGYGSYQLRVYTLSSSIDWRI